MPGTHHASSIVKKQEGEFLLVLPDKAEIVSEIFGLVGNLHPFVAAGNDVINLIVGNMPSGIGAHCLSASGCPPAGRLGFIYVFFYLTFFLINEISLLVTIN